MSELLSENVSKLMEFMGLDRITAENLLRINNHNLERAINYHLMNDTEYAVAGCSSQVVVNDAPVSASVAAVDPSTAVSESATLPDDDDNNIRAPIPPKREQLILPEDDNFRHRKRRAPVFTVCPLRNFAREAEMQEQQLSWYMENKDAIEARKSHRLKAKRSRLEDLFCPPIDLLFWGTFQAAREHAVTKNRWLIVNLQDNAEFKSQILNRDIWTDPALKDIILKYFVLWQVSVDNADGLRFQTFYHVENLPYVCIIDPRTGEKKLACDVVTPQTFTTELMDFLGVNLFSLEPKEQNYVNVPQPGPSTSKSMQKTSTITKPSATGTTTTTTSILSSTITTQSSSSTSSSSTTTDNNRSEFQMSELSEEDQLKLAIRNSLKETKAISNSLDDRESILFGTDLDDTNSDNDLSDNDNDIATAETYETYLGDKKDPLTRIQLRLPAGERIVLEWPKSTKIRAIHLYVVSKHPEIAKDPYKIISAFPRQNILELDDKLSLEDAKLHPTAILHIHPDD